MGAIFWTLKNGLILNYSDTKYEQDRYMKQLLDTVPPVKVRELLRDDEGYITRIKTAEGIVYERSEKETP